MRRWPLLVAGGIALVLGLVLFVLPGTTGGDLGPALVTGLGIVALLQALRLGRQRWRSEVRWAETPDPERPGVTPSPGDDLEGVFEEFTGDRSHGVRTRTRDGLESIAVAALTAYAGCDRAEARERVERGTWTDDVHAAAFLGDVPPPETSVRDRLAGLVGRRSAFERDLSHTVDAITRVARLQPLSLTGDHPSPNRPRTVSPADDAASDAGASLRTTENWRGVSAVALLCLGAGLVGEAPAVVLTGVVGLGYGAYARSGSEPSHSLTVEREVSDSNPDPDDPVTVRVTVRNDGDRTLPDVRLVDGVPEALAVDEGSPRHGTTLRPGSDATFSYTVTARRGEHEFTPTLAIVRDITGSFEREVRIPEPTTITCVPRLRAPTSPVPLRHHVTQNTGRVAADTGGDGVEFHATREYRSGDPLNRVDWNRKARTGEFSTLEFREERSTTVVLVVDGREPSHVSPVVDGPSAVDRSVDAAGQLYAHLSGAGNRVGITALGERDCWLSPGAGADHRVRARDLLARDPAFGPLPGGETTALAVWNRQFRRQLTGDAQVFFLTPLADAAVARVARQIDAYGYPVTVVSPDPGADRDPGHRLARVVRQLRITELRRAGIPVVDWAWTEPLDVALSRHARVGVE